MGAVLERGKGSSKDTHDVALGSLGRGPSVPEGRELPGEARTFLKQPLSPEDTDGAVKCEFGFNVMAEVFCYLFPVKWSCHRVANKSAQ